MLKLSSIFFLLFITLGPIKTIVPFVALTAGAEVGLVRMVALRASVASTVVVLLLCLVGTLILENWGVSFSAVALTGGLTLFLASLQVMMASSEAAAVKPEKQEALAMSMLISRLVIPTIVTPPGIATILVLMVLSERNQQLWLQTIGFILAVMVLNFMAMLSARRLLAVLTIAGMRVIGWVFAVLQAALGVQIIINSLRRLGALPIQ